MKAISFFPAACLALLVISCSVKETADPSSEHPRNYFTVTAYQETPELTDTKTTRFPDGSIQWVPGDEIGLFKPGGETYYTCELDHFSADIEEPTPQARFSGYLTDYGESFHPYTFAFYPCDAVVFVFYDGEFAFEIPEEQTAAAGVFPSDLYVMAARSDNNDFHFSNVLGGLKITVAHKNVTAITLETNGGEDLGGQFRVKFDDNGRPYFKERDQYYPSIRLLPEGGTFQVGEPYYFILPPVVLEHGFTLKYYGPNVHGYGSTEATEESGAISTDKRVEIKPSVFGVLNGIDAKITDWVDYSDEIEEEHQVLLDFYHATGGENWGWNQGWEEEYIPHRNFVNGIGWDENGFVIRIDIFDNNLTGTLPASLSKLKHLKELHLTSNHISGDLPDWLCDFPELESLALNYNQFSGSIPAEIGKLSHLRYLDLSNNQLTGSVPESLALLSNLESFFLKNNQLDGSVSSGFVNWPLWAEQGFWGQAGVYGNRVDVRGTVKNPTFSVQLIGGETYTSDRIADNQLTVLFQTATWCPYSNRELATLKALYSKYKEKGLDILSWYMEDKATVQNYLDTKGVEWNTFISQWTNLTSEMGPDYFPNTIVPGYLSYPPTYNNEMSFPTITIFDKSGSMVYYYGGRGFDESVSAFISGWYGDPDEGGMYESTDYSSDGTVTTLQTATEGAGIDLVVMGDAYADVDVAEGLYDRRMQAAVDAFFSEEPFKTYRHLFNVYQVTIVSKNQYYVNGAETALGLSFYEGTGISGNNETVFSYAMNAVTNLDDCLIIVVANNADHVAGTCSMYMEEGDYGAGPSIAYCADFIDFLPEIIHHEACGHGFGKLADEYDDGVSIISDASKDYLRFSQELGFYRNIDLTDDPQAVLWAHFLADPRYADEGLGVFEGGMAKRYGVWRSTQTSIMRYNTGGFNAPSRERIWYRIQRLSQGSGWQYDRDAFFAYDAVNRGSVPAQCPYHSTLRNEQHWHCLPPTLQPWAPMKSRLESKKRNL